MLLNQLGVHRGCEIVFDTSSVMAMVRPEDSEPQSGTLVACVCFGWRGRTFSIAWRVSVHMHT
jgi:hypothetical protein